MLPSFTFIWRNPEHWDVAVNGSRAFCIRGDRKEGYWIRDERAEGSPFPRDSIGPFSSLHTATLWITSTLMKEDL